MKKDSQIFYLISGYINKFLNFYISRSIYGRAAFFMISAVAIISSAPLAEIALKAILAIKDDSQTPVILPIYANPDILKFTLSGILLLLAMLCLKKAEQSKLQRVEENRLIFETKSAEIAKIGASRIHTYCGSVTEISNISIVVTSEDSDLDLGSLSGTSVSGRTRTLAATKSASGEVIRDNLGDFIKNWKIQNSKYSNFDLGTCIVCDSSYEARTSGIETIIFAVGIRKNSTGVATISEAAIKNIISFAVKTAISKNQKSIFLPIFGLGSGNVAQADAIKATVNAVKSKLLNCDQSFDIYLGVYRFDDLSKLCLYLSQLDI